MPQPTIIDQNASDTPRRGRRRDVSLQDRVLAAAAEIFLDRGFGLATMDEVAKAAGASKKTLYQHFANKDEAFIAVVAWLCDVTVDQLRALQIGAESPPVALHSFARRLIDLLLLPETLALHRMVMAEATRFPDLGLLFHQRGPEQVHATLCAYLQGQVAKGRLNLCSVGMAAECFIAMATSEIQRKALFGVEIDPPGPVREEKALAAVAFLLAYAGWKG